MLVSETEKGAYRNPSTSKPPYNMNQYDVDSVIAQKPESQI